MDNIDIEKSAKYIKKIYGNLSYFDQYGTSVLLFIIITLIVFLVNAYCVVMVQANDIKNDWVNQRCNPKVIPFAGFINKPDDKTFAEFTQENFTYCIQNILTTISADAVTPLTYAVNIITKLYQSILNAIQEIREMFNKIRDSLQAVLTEIMGRVMNIVIPIQTIIIGITDTFAKIQGTLVAGLFTSLGTYYTLKTLLGAIVELIVKILIALAVVIATLWILPFTWGAAASMTAIFLGISIPLAIIVLFLTQVLHVHSSGIPTIHCFDKDTKIKMNNGTYKIISEIEVGEKLDGDVFVSASLKLDANNVDMYNLQNVIVSGCHKVKYENKWISVATHPDSKKIAVYDEPFIYCLNTTSKNIVIDNMVFSDWDELYDEKNMNTVKQLIVEKFSIEPKEINIHKYLDGGFVGSTVVVMQDKSQKKITDLRINDVLENGEKVCGLVEIEGLEITEQSIFNLGENKYFEGGPNLNFYDKNLGKLSTLHAKSRNSIVKHKKLYHLLTDTKSFYIGDLKFDDYNSAIDFLI